MTLEELLDKWKINRTMLASKMGMTKGLFCNKLSDKTPKYRFFPEELERLYAILAELKSDLELTTTQKIEKEKKP